MLMWFFVILHCLLCLAAYLLMKMRILKSPTMIMPPVVFVPVFGFACLAVLEWRTRMHQEADMEVGIEKLKINDETYRSILMEEDPAKNLMVPLQEALLMNDGRTRRELIMDILYHDTGQYVEVLQKAKLNDDVEVVHYATTAMVELQKDYEAELVRRREAFEERKESEERRRAYADVLEAYIGSGLLEGNVKRVRQEEYCDLLKYMIERSKEDEKLQRELYRKRFDQLLALGRLQEVLESALYVTERWPDMEDGYLFQIRLAVEKKEGSEVRRLIGLLEEKGIYLSADARKIVAFWKGKDEGKQGEEKENIPKKRIS